MISNYKKNEKYKHWIGFTHEFVKYICRSAQKKKTGTPLDVVWSERYHTHTHEQSATTVRMTMAVEKIFAAAEVSLLYENLLINPVTGGKRT